MEDGGWREVREVSEGQESMLPGRRSDDDQKRLRGVLFIMMWSVCEHRSLRHVQKQTREAASGQHIQVQLQLLTRRLPFRGLIMAHAHLLQLLICSSWAAPRWLGWAEWLNRAKTATPSLRHSWSLLVTLSSLSVCLRMSRCLRLSY